MKFYAFIFARGGSKGLKKKNILNLDGKPLINHSIDIAKEIKNIEQIFVSTDDKEIANIAINNGAKVINRPKELAGDKSSEWLAWQHAINYIFKIFGEFEGFISLPATAPLRSKEDVEKCIFKLEDNADLIVTITKSKKHPSFNMVKIFNEDKISLLEDNKDNIHRRQDVSTVYDITTVAYVSTAQHILKSKGLWDGVVKAVEVPFERSIDIDTKIDFEFAKFLLKNKT